MKFIISPEIYNLKKIGFLDKKHISYFKKQYNIRYDSPKKVGNQKELFKKEAY